MTETARTTAAADPAAPPPPPARATGTVPQPAHGVPDAPAAPRRLGVEEEFHLVDRVTRRLAPRAPELLDLLSSEDCYVAEMQQCVVETNTAVVDDLPALRNELIARRTGWPRPPHSSVSGSSRPAPCRSPCRARCR